MKEFFKKVWEVLNGNKTWICAFIWLLIEKGIIPITGNWYDIIQWILTVITGGSLAHHIAKGYLNTNKGS